MDEVQKLSNPKRNIPALESLRIQIYLCLKSVAGIFCDTYATLGSWQYHGAKSQSWNVSNLQQFLRQGYCTLPYTRFQCVISSTQTNADFWRRYSIIMSPTATANKINASDFKLAYMHPFKLSSLDRIRKIQLIEDCSLTI
jgi:hypothetical protein